METHSHIPSIEELRTLRSPVRNVVAEEQEHFTGLERLALWITQKVGSMGFFLIVFFWTILWLAWNVLAPASLRFDPFPSFVFWLFISNMIQLFLTPLIMVGQNLQGRYAERRAQMDFEINKKAEREVEAILLHLENQSELVVQILDRLEKSVS